MLKQKLTHKFGNKPIEIDNIFFRSTKEGRRYEELKLLVSAKEVLFFLRQIPFSLPGKTKYICDFMVFWKNGEVTIEDTKGMRTPMYILKKKQVEELYPFQITEI